MFKLGVHQILFSPCLTNPFFCIDQVHHITHNFTCWRWSSSV